MQHESAKAAFNANPMQRKSAKTAQFQISKHFKSRNAASKATHDGEGGTSKQRQLNTSEMQHKSAKAG
jgi:hypothetical protein